MFKKTLFILCFSCQTFAAQNEFLYLGPTPYVAGFFSVFTTVIGCLDQYEKEPYAGLVVNFEDQGCYYDSDIGLNWWNYYFEPIDFGKINNAKPIIMCSQAVHYNFAIRTLFELSTERSAELVQKYIHVKPFIQKQVDDFEKNCFKNSFMIGVHYRGTDKHFESPRVSYEILAAEINQIIVNLNLDSYQIFLATDEADFLRYLEITFPNKVIYNDSYRSSTGIPIHTHPRNRFESGEEALIDCILLSKCDYLIRTSSNLSLCSTFFNAQLPFKLLNPGEYDKKQSTTQK